MPMKGTSLPEPVISIATGVLMEASSVEDKGKGLSFCVFCYNVQPGIKIDLLQIETQKNFIIHIVHPLVI